jgi:hypothetical protein
MLVERETLASYRYLEHGAFYAILALALMMFIGAVTHISEVVTGLIGAGFIVTAFVDSIRYNRRAVGSEPLAVLGAAEVDVHKILNPPESPRAPVPEPAAQSRPE